MRVPTLTPLQPQLTPFPHTIVENVLDKEFFELLRDEVLKEKYYLKTSDLFEFLQTADLRQSKHETVQALQTMLHSDEFLDFVQQTFSVRLTGTIDLFGAIYQQTHYLLPHDDRLEKRKIAFVLYLNTIKEGGSLLLYSRKGIPLRIPPKANSMVLFEVSPKSIHQVEEVFGEEARASIGGWLS